MKFAIRKSNFKTYQNQKLNVRNDRFGTFDHFEILLFEFVLEFDIRISDFIS